MGEVPLYTLEVKVHPNSSKRTVEFHEDGVHIYTPSPPLEGKANRDVIKIISDAFYIPKRDIVLFRGEKTKDKVFHITERAVELIRERSKGCDRNLSRTCSKVLNYLKER